MRRQLLTRRGSTVAYPLLLDDFESNNLSKWSTANSAQFSVTGGSLDPSGLYTVLYTYRYVTGAIEGIMLQTNPAGWDLARGERVSVITYSNPSGGTVNGISLHGTGATSTSKWIPDTGYYAYRVGNASYIGFMSNGATNQLAGQTFGGLPDVCAIVVWINPLSHPTNPGVVTMEMRTPDMNTLYGTLTGTPGSTYDYSGTQISLLATSVLKGSGNVYFDRVRIEGKN